MRSVSDNWWLVKEYCNALTARAVAGSPTKLRRWREENRSPAFRKAVDFFRLPSTGDYNGVAGDRGTASKLEK